MFDLSLCASMVVFLFFFRPSNPVQYLAAFLLKNDPHPPPQQIEVSFEDAASKYAAATEQGEKLAPA